MNIVDKIVVTLMGFCIICAVLTLVSYLLYELWNIGEAYFSIIFFICAMFGAVSFMIVATVMLNKKDGVKE